MQECLLNIAKGLAHKWPLPGITAPLLVHVVPTKASAKGQHCLLLHGLFWLAALEKFPERLFMTSFSTPFDTFCTGSATSSGTDQRYRPFALAQSVLLAATDKASFALSGEEEAQVILCQPPERLSVTAHRPLKHQLLLFLRTTSTQHFQTHYNHGPGWRGPVLKFAPCPLYQLIGSWASPKVGFWQPLHAACLQHALCLFWQQ